MAVHSKTLPVGLAVVLIALGTQAQGHTNPRLPAQGVRVAQAPAAAQAGQLPATDFQHQVMTQISPGTWFVASDFSKEVPKFWNRLVLFVEGRLGSGDVDAATDSIVRFTKLFNLVILANVNQVQGKYYLERAGVGFSTKVQGRDTVITLDTERELGANLGFIGRSVFEANEAALKDIIQVARTTQAIMFDAPTRLLYKDEHQMMTVRYLIWVNPTSGEVRTLVWQMDAGDQQRYVAVDNTFQSLKPGMIEDRVMNVKGDRINFLGIPAPDAFALVRIPQGTAYRFNEVAAQLATLKKYDEKSFQDLLLSLDQAMAQR